MNLTKTTRPCAKSVILLLVILFVFVPVAWSLCQDSSQCPAGTTCDLTWKLCTTQISCLPPSSDGFCTSTPGLDHASYMYLCVGGYCHVLSGRCSSSADCPKSEYCKGKYCTLRDGFCDVDSQCTGSYQICNSSSHRCQMAAGRCNRASDCPSYQTCDSYHYCVHRSGRCDGDTDCEYWQECNATHYCAPKAGRCKSDSDCSFYEQCRNITHECELQAGFCDQSYQCPANADCDQVSHRCAYWPGYCGTDLDCVLGYCDHGRCTKEPSVEAAQNDVVVIFDNSGSMASDNKINRSRQAAVRTLSSLQNDQTRYSLYSFNQCTPVHNLNFTAQKQELIDKIRQMKPIGSTPLASTLSQAYQYAQSSNAGRERSFILLFTDGEETCQGDPCAVVQNLSSNLKTPVYTIGYIVGASEERQLQCIASASGGAYYPAGNDADLLNKMKETLYVAGVKCSDDSQCPSRFVCESRTCVPAKIHLVFVRLNGLSQADFDSEVRQQSQFFLTSIPSLANCTNRVRVSTTAGDCTVSSLGADAALDYAAVQRCLQTQMDASEFDYFIGVAPSGGINIPGFPNVVGYMLPFSNGVFVTPGSSVVTAHELGHQFGLHDEYCSDGVNCNREPNPLRAEYGCDPGGDCCWNGTRLWPLPIKWGCSHPYGAICCEGNTNSLGGRSIMTWADADAPRLHDAPSLEHLAQNPLLRCD